MQAHLKDLASQHGSQSFLICRRVLNQCHEMIYADLPASGAPYSALNTPRLPGHLLKKVRPNVQPALVGIGLILAGVPAMPALTEVMGEVAIEQGRIDDRGADLRSVENLDGVVRPHAEITDDADKDEDNSEPEDDREDKLEEEPVQAAPMAVSLPATRSAKEGKKDKPPSRRQTIAAQTSPALPLHVRDPRKPRLSEDPFGQYDTPAPVPSATPFQSTPSFSGWRHPRRPNSLNTAEVLLQKYDFVTQRYLLRTHYCRSEVCLLFNLPS